MTHTIHLAAELPATPERVYGTYLDRRHHAAFTGAPAKIAARAGAEFSAFDGVLRGTILQLVPKRLIVQSWGSKNWKSGDVESTLILSLHPVGRGKTLLELVQVNVPEQDFAGVSQGWERYYWAPWREYLSRPRQPAASKARSGGM